MTSRNVNINIGANTRRYKKAVRSAEKATTKFGGSIGKIGKIAVAAGAAAVVAIAAVGAVALKVGINATQGFAKFEQSMSRIEGLVGVSHEAVAAFGDEVKDLAIATGVGPQKLAEGLFFITSAGLEGAEAMEALEVSAKASAAGLGEVTIIADVVTSAVNAFGDSMGGAAVATDVLVATVREGKADAASLATAMGRVIPIASQMGISFDQVGAAIAAMTRVGLDAAEASTALRSIMVSLLKPTTQADEALASMGLSAAGLRDQIRSEGLFATLQSLTDAFDGNSDATVAVFGNIRALSGVMALMGDNAEATEQIFKELADSTGALDTAFGVTAETGAFAFEQARARIDVALLGVGEKLLPIIADAVDDIIPSIEGLISAFGDLAVILAEIGSAVIPPVVGFFEDIPKHARSAQIFGLEINKWIQNFNTVVTLGIQTEGTFDSTARAQLKFLNIQNQLFTEMKHGVDITDAGINALHLMSGQYIINTENLGVLQRQLGLTDEEMLALITEFEDSRIAADGWDQSIGALAEHQGLLGDAIDENKPKLAELVDSWNVTAGAAGRVAKRIPDVVSALASMEGTAAPIVVVRDALREAADAGRSLADALLEMSSPTFKAIKAVKALKTAQENAVKVSKDRKSSTEDIAAAELAVVEATLRAQGALDALAFDPQNLEASILAIQSVLGNSRAEALEMLETLGILDGTQIKMLLELETSITGPLQDFGASAFENQDVRFRAHGGPVSVGGAYVVGEVGAELFIPDAAGRIIPNGNLATITTSTSTDSSKTINLYIEGTETPGQDAESLLLLAGLVA